MPSPNVSEDHQRKNALALVERDAAVMILDDEAQAKLAGEIKRLIGNSDERKKLSNNILKMALPDADEKIVDAVERIITHYAK